MQPDCVRSLRARLAEDEAAANAAGGEAWEQGTRYHERNIVRPVGGFDWVGVTGTRYDTPPVITAQVASTPRDLFEARATHIARHDPARVLPLVDAHRSILDEYEALAAECQGEPESAAILAWVERVVLPALASAYSAKEDGSPDAGA